MHQDRALSAVLSDFARTLVTDFPIQRILDHLVGQIVGVLPVTGAGVTLISQGKAPQFIAASDDSALSYEQLQTGLGEGPCLAAYRTGVSVRIPDLAKDKRFSRFSPAAREAGLAAVFTFPLRHGERRLGALDLYRDTPGELDRSDQAAAQTLADVATAYLLNARAREEVQAAADRFQHSSLHDVLTGLPNRLLLAQRLEHAGRRAQRSRSYAAVLFVDLDKFKTINDVHGHGAGDELLRDVARRLSSLIRPGDTLARVSGDEFVFLCEDLKSAADGELLAHRIRDTFDSPFTPNGIAVSVAASVGVAFAGPGEEVSEDLVARADAAMYRAKRARGEGRHILDLRSDAPTHDRDDLDEDLRAAIGQPELRLAFQPIVRCHDGVVTGAEALLRWKHPTRGNIPAELTIAIAERSHLIHDLGIWVLQQACREYQRWPHHLPLDLAVNVSAVQLMGPQFSTAVRDVLEMTGINPELLTLEITESVFMEDIGAAVERLSSLREPGVNIALDDFGTGFSSLSYLRQLPITVVKIDRSFVADIDASSRSAPIVSAIMTLARALDLTVTAEGVETSSQRAALASLGCHRAQGHFYSKPLAPSGILRLLSQSEGGYPPSLPRSARIRVVSGTTASPLVAT